MSFSAIRDGQTRAIQALASLAALPLSSYFPPFLSLTPGPSPFSATKITPANSSLSRTRPRSSGRDHGSPDSKVKTAFSLTPTRNASLMRVQPSSSRAALTCSGVDYGDTPSNAELGRAPL
jgi:hypothetical protein